MKILCLQLARYGDIYQTWPVLNALKRVEPTAKIHFLVRERFKDALEGLESVERTLTLNTPEIIEPLLSSQPNAAKSLQLISEFVSHLRSESYDMIVNLSFSPFSSYLVDLIAGPQTIIRGYTRHRDGYFNVADDASSYFYAQVGVDKVNRIHLTDLFALIAGVELIDADFTVKNVAQLKVNELPQTPYVVVHLGASQKNKTCTREAWEQIIQGVLANYDGQVVFVGSSGDADLKPQNLPTERVCDWVGRTKLPELIPLIQNANLLIGCDSVALHMASLVNTPTLNISFSQVRFWETGPRARGSRIVWFEDNQHLEVQLICDEARRMLTGQPPGEKCIFRVDGSGVIYDMNGYQDDDFCWELCRALYMSHPFPASNLPTVRTGFTRLKELAIVGLENLNVISKPEQRGMAVSILNEVDSLIEYVGKFVPEISPVVRWFQAEKLRIGPGRIDEVVSHTRELFEKLRDICQIYSVNQVMNDNLNRTDLTWKS